VARTVRFAIAAAVAGCAITAATLTVATPTAARPPVLELEFLGEQIVPTGTQFEDTEFGGLSGLAYDAGRDLFYAMSDDQGVIDPVRFYTLRLDASDGRLDDGDVEIVDVTTLLDTNGLPFVPASLDPEGLALTNSDELVVTSEGIATRLIDPFIRRFELDGTAIAEVPVPPAFLLDATATHGVRLNLGFESAATRGRVFFTANEGALVQDGAAASVAAGSPVRILRYRLPNGRAERQFLYWTDPIAEPPIPSTAFAVNGLVELLPLGNRRLLAMERSFSVGAPGTGNTIRLYDVRLAGADDISRFDSLAGRLDRIRPVTKELVLDLDELGIPLDNVEGMAMGPVLPDGRRSLLLVSDNNFSPAGFTQFLLFAVDD
jgi:hypothetical protein